MLDRKQTSLGMMGYFCIGVTAVLIPSVMPSITSEFFKTGITLATIGLIFPAASVGSILGNLLVGIGSDVIGRRWLVGLAAFVLAIALVLAASAQLWGLFVIGFVVVSTSQGALATGINAMIADANPTSRARALNALHGVYGLGATLSPLVIGLAIDRGVPWRWAMGGISLLWLVYSVLVRRSSQTVSLEKKAGPPLKLSLAMFRKGPFIALFLVAFCYNGIAGSLLGWIAIFMRQSVGLSNLFSVYTISIFYVGLTTGRFICAGIGERFSYARILQVLGLGIAVTYPLVVLGNYPVVVVAGVLLIGLSLSGLYPTALAFGSRLYPEQTGKLSGTLSIALTLGSMLPPLWTSAIAQHSSFQVALSVNYLMAALLIALTVYLGRIERPAAVAQPQATLS